jgi:hypothetical protein
MEVKVVVHRRVLIVFATITTTKIVIQIVVEVLVHEMVVAAVVSGVIILGLISIIAKQYFLFSSN